MLATRSSKRVAGKQNADSKAKTAKVFPTVNVQENKRYLNRDCKQVLQRDILKEKEVHDVNNTNQKVASKSAAKPPTGLAKNKLILQNLKNNESKKVKESSKLNKKIKVDKENNLSNHKIHVSIPPKELGKTKNKGARKIKDCVPLKTISNNAIGHVPIWAVNKSLLQKQKEKQSRVSDIYNIEKDEDLMNEPSLHKKKKIGNKPQVVKKLLTKKAIPSYTSQKGKFFTVKAAMPVGQFSKGEGLTVNSPKTKTVKTNLSKPTLQNPKNLTVSALKLLDPVPELHDSGLESESHCSMINSEMPFAAKEIAIENNKKAQGDKGYTENCINDCYSSFVNIDTSYISLRTSVAKCLNKLTNNEMPLDKHSTDYQDKNSSHVEDCINDCYSSFMNVDISLREPNVKSMAKIKRIEKTPEKISSINSEVGKVPNNSKDHPIFLLPKMASTPENVGSPIVQSLKQLSNNGELKLSEVSTVPSPVSRNIVFELSGYDISPIKPVSVNQEASLFGLPSKENKNPKEQIGLPEKIGDLRQPKGKTKMKITERNRPVQNCKLTKNASERIYLQTIDNHENIQKDNVKDRVPETGFKRNGLISPLKTIEIDFSSNQSPVDVDEDQNALLNHRNNKCVKKLYQKPTESKKTILKSVNKVSDSSQKESSICTISLFDSPKKMDKNILKSKYPSFKAEKRKMFPEKTASLLAEDDFIKVLKPANCYQSPHQVKKQKPRTKAAHNEKKKIKNNDKPDPPPKKHIYRTKAALEEKQKLADQNEQKFINSLNLHFAEFDNMELCVE